LRLQFFHLVNFLNSNGKINFYIFKCYTFLVIARKGESNEIHEDRCNLRGLNLSVQIILSSTVNQLNTDQIITVWDTLNVVVKFLLLNQTGVTQLSFNVTQQIQANVSNLNWSALPANVQSFLLTESLSSIFSLTFSQWAWVDLNSAFANATLFSLLSSKVQNCANNASSLISPLNFDTPINVTALNQTLLTAFPNLKNFNVVNRFFEAFYESIPQFSVFNVQERKKSLKGKFLIQQISNGASMFGNSKKQPSVSSTFQCALKRARDLLRSIKHIN
jgi:hypothetical protein